MNAPLPTLTVATPEHVAEDMRAGRRRMTPARIEARDRRLVAIHEAAHMVIAHHVGAPSTAWIFRWPTDDPTRERTWGGKTILGCKPSRPHRAMIGVAGAVAEHVWSGELDFLRDEGEFVWGEPEVMSDADWRLAGCAPGEPDNKFMGAVDEVIDLLAGSLRADLYAEARRLIVEFGRAAA